MAAPNYLDLARSAQCAWPSRGVEIAVRILPLTAHPVLSPNQAVLGGASQADFLLAALGAKGVPGSLNCTRRAVAPSLETRSRKLVIAQYWNWHAAAAAGALDGARGFQRAEAHYAALRSLMQPDAGGRAPVALLMHASEWATDATLKEVHSVLRRFAIDVDKIVFVHFNHGVMRDIYMLRRSSKAPLWAPLQDWAQQQGLRSRPAVAPLKQAYWQSMLWILASRRPATGRRRQQGAIHFCRPAARATAARATPALAPAPGDLAPAPFLLLGGNPRYFRGLVMLDLARRGLLPSRARWSGSRFGFCDGDSMRWVGQPGVSKSFFRGSEGRPPPFALGEQRRLLGDAPLVRSLCSALPKVLDVAPDVKSDSKVLDSDDAIWRNVRLSLTFESDMVSGDAEAELLFVTEKTIKPIQNGVPFIVLGSAGALATLRALGFRTFAPAINETYDRVLDGAQRLQSALTEVERLTSLSDVEWRQIMRDDGPLAEAVRHNQRLVLCGGFRRTLGAHAVQLVSRALELRSKPKTGGLLRGRAGRDSLETASLN